MKRFKYTDVYVDSEVDTMKYATKEEQARFENIAREVGKAHGYTEVNVKIEDFEQFKVKWTRTYRFVNFHVSDYLCGAPDDVVRDIFDVVFFRFTGTEDRKYSASTNKYLTTKVAGKYRRTYCARNNIEPHKFTEFKGIPIHFAKAPLYAGKVGGASVLMKVIAVNPIYKDEGEEFINAIIKAEYNAIQSGLSNFGIEGEPVEVNNELLKGFMV